MDSIIRRVLPAFNVTLTLPETAHLDLSQASCPKIDKIQSGGCGFFGVGNRFDHGCNIGGGSLQRGLIAGAHHKLG